MKFLKLALAIGLSLAAGAIGSLATTPNIPIWYAALSKPPLTPPNQVFGPVWTTLYILMGVSLYLIWTSKGRDKRAAYILFGVQLALNTLWSLVFFGLRQPWLGVLIIALLLAAIILTIRQFKQYNRAAA